MEVVLEVGALTYLYKKSVSGVSRETSVCLRIACCRSCRANTGDSLWHTIILCSLPSLEKATAVGYMASLGASGAIAMLGDREPYPSLAKEKKC